MRMEAAIPAGYQRRCDHERALVPSADSGRACYLRFFFVFTASRFVISLGCFRHLTLGLLFILTG